MIIVTSYYIETRYIGSTLHTTGTYPLWAGDSDFPHDDVGVTDVNALC